MTSQVIRFDAKSSADKVSVLVRHYCGPIGFLPSYSSWRATPAAGFPNARNVCTSVLGGDVSGAPHCASVTAFLDVVTDTLYHEIIPSQDGGFTFDPRTLKLANLKPGQYVVGLFGGERRFLDRPDYQELRNWVSFVYGRLLRDKTAFIGGWRNEADSCLYLDVSTVFDSLDTAMAFARDNLQQAIYDVSARNTISVR